MNISLILLAKNLVIRWTFGETRARKTSAQAWDMLECSLKFARFLFSNADYVVCYNNLTREVRDIVERISRENGAHALDVSEMLPPNLRINEVKNSWWKYSPTRIAVDKYEIVMDNDVVLWELPPTLLQAIETRSLVALTDATGQYYGDFHEAVIRSNPTLRLNAGLVGMPEGYAIDLENLKDKTFTDFFHSEQGFTALNFINYRGNKTLVPTDQVPQLNACSINGEELISEYCGGHFCGCSFGHYDFWEKKYAKFVKENLNDKARKMMTE